MSSAFFVSSLIEGSLASAGELTSSAQEVTGPGVKEGAVALRSFVGFEVEVEVAEFPVDGTVGMSLCSGMVIRSSKEGFERPESPLVAIAHGGSPVSSDTRIVDRRNLCLGKDVAVDIHRAIGRGSVLVGQQTYEASKFKEQQGFFISHLCLVFMSSMMQLSLGWRPRKKRVVESHLGKASHASVPLNY